MKMHQKSSLDRVSETKVEKMVTLVDMRAVPTLASTHARLIGSHPRQKCLSLARLP